MSFQRSWELGAYLKIKMLNPMVCKDEKIHDLCENGPEKSIPHDRRLSNFSKPRDVKR